MRDSISQCIAHFRGDRANPLFSKHIRIADATIRNWQCWADRPTLDLLLRMCYRLNISPLRFVTADIGTQTFNLGNEIEKALKEAISLRGGSTLMEVAGELGYKITRPLTSRFPELSAEVSRIKREATHAAIELALTEAPAPSVKDVARRMGYKSERELRSDFPDLYRRISARQKECRKDQWRLTLLAALREYPPPSLNGICKRLKTSSSQLKLAFPKLCSQISSERQDYLSTYLIQERERTREAIRDAVRALRSKGICPTTYQVLKLLRLEGRKCRFFSEMLSEVRKDLGVR